MPFRLRVLKVEYAAPDISISGELIEGAYGGPQAVSLCARGGQWSTVPVTHHELLFPKGWPAVTGDGATLILHVPAPSPEFLLDDSQLVIGRGALYMNSNRRDITDSLPEPGFWAVQLWLYLQSAEIQNPPEMCWGLSKEQANGEYARFIEQHWKAGAWPYIRLPVDDHRYVEIEYSAGVEYQRRIWIGNLDGRRVILGYDSGHFSLPAFRMDELLVLANHLTVHPSAPLLLLPGVYLESEDLCPTEQVTQWLAKVPGVQVEIIPLMAKALFTVVPKVLWESDDTYGWTNNSKYSQRNPKSSMSTLSSDDYQFIREFLGQP
jgi:hypothetical protein